MRMFKRLAAALTAATLAVGLSAAPPVSAGEGAPGSSHPHDHGTRSRLQWSADGGVFWDATESVYNTGEAGADGGNGPDAGTYRRRQVFLCDGGYTSPVPRPAPDQMNEGEAASPDDLNCIVMHHVPFAHNVDDGTEPEGDWCASGAAQIICRGGGYSYAEAREALGF